jgi:MFS family permease
VPGAASPSRIAALVLLAVVAGHPSQVTTALALTVFGLGFGMVGQVLIVAVQNGVDRRRLGVAMAATSFFRGLGGAVGAAMLGAVFAARVGDGAARADVIGGVQLVFVVAAPIAAVALAVVLLLHEVPLQTSQNEAPGPRLAPDAQAALDHGRSGLPVGRPGGGLAAEHGPRRRRLAGDGP